MQSIVVLVPERCLRPGQAWDAGDDRDIAGTAAFKTFPAKMDDVTEA